MKNEYGLPLDRNGYAPSLLNASDTTEGLPRCYLCGRTGPLQRHEVFFGPYRSKSKRLGLWANLCQGCHQGQDGVHNNRKADLHLKRQAQKAAMHRYGWTKSDFIAQFGQNYVFAYPPDAEPQPPITPGDPDYDPFARKEG